MTQEKQTPAQLAAQFGVSEHVILKALRKIKASPQSLLSDADRRELHDYVFRNYVSKAQARAVIRRVCYDLDINREQLGHRIGRSKSQVSHYVTGHTRMPRIMYERIEGMINSGL